LKLIWTLACSVLLVGCGDGSVGGPQQPRVAPKKLPGQLTYQRFCFSCHASGAAGAPRMGDVAAWAPRIEKGEEVLIQSTIQGIPPGMPPRGLCMQCSDEELAATVRFMLNVSR
jgi:cytochrome c5